MSVSFSAKRVAFVVGINSYQKISRLQNPVADANAIADLLQKNGFTVFRSIDPDKARFLIDLKIFSEAALVADEAFIYYAGHGLAALHNGKFSNILAPVDASLSCESRDATNVLTISELVASVKTVPKKVFVFDACRDNPFNQCEAGPNIRPLGFSQQPLSSFAQQSNTADGNKNTGSSLLVFSTDLGSVALDGPPGKNSPFADSMLRKLALTPRNTMRSVFSATSKDVAERSGYLQVPWVTSIGGDPIMCLAGENCNNIEALSSQVLVGRSNRLAEEAEKLVKEGFAKKALALALEALPDNRNKPDRPYLGRAEKILREAMVNAFPILANDKALKNFNTRLLAVSPDRIHAATRLENNQISIRNIVRNTIVSTLTLPQGDFSKASFSPDGKHVITREDTGLLRIWSISSGRSLYQHQDQQYSGHIVWSRSGKTAFITTEITHNTVYEVSETKSKAWSWSMKNGRVRVLAKLGTMPNIDQLAINGKKDHLVFSYTLWRSDGNAEYRIRSVRIKGFTQVFDRKIGVGTINAITVSPDYNSMLLASGDGIARLVLAENGKIIHTLKGHESTYSGLTIAKFSPDSKWLLTAGGDGVVRVWNTETGQRRWGSMSGTTGKLLQMDVNNSIRAVDWGPDNRIIAVSSGNSVKLWNIVSNSSAPTAVATIRNENRPVDFKGYDGVEMLSFGPDGTKIIIGINGSTLFDVSGIANHNNHGLELLRLKLGGSGLGNIELLPDGNRLYLTNLGDYEQGGILDIKAGRMLHKFRQTDLRAKGASANVSRDGKFAASATDIPYQKPGTKNLYSDPHIVVTSLQTGKIVWKHRAKPYLPTIVTISPDNRTLAVSMVDVQASDPLTIFAIQLWRIGENEPIGVLKGHVDHITGLVFTPDGKRLISTSQDKTSKVWNLQTQKETMTFKGASDAMGNHALSADGLFFATAKPRFRIWDLESGKMTKEFPFKSGNVHLSRDGKYALLSAGYEQLRLVDLQSGEIILEPEPSNIVESAILTQNPLRLIYTLPDGHIIVRSLENKFSSIISEACKLNPILLSKIEREVLRLPTEPDKPICLQLQAANQ